MLLAQCMEALRFKPLNRYLLDKEAKVQTFFGCEIETGIVVNTT